MDITCPHDRQTMTVLPSSKVNLNLQPETTAVCTNVGAFAASSAPVPGSVSTLAQHRGHLV